MLLALGHRRGTPCAERDLGGADGLVDVVGTRGLEEADVAALRGRVFVRERLTGAGRCPPAVDEIVKGCGHRVFTARNSPLPTGTRQVCELGISRHQSDERCQLVHVRDRVIHDQQTSTAQHATQLRPPARVLLALGIQEDQVVSAFIAALQEAPRVVVNQGDERREPGAREVGGGEPQLVLSRLHGRDRAANPTGRVSEPEGGVPVGRADLQHPARGRRPYEHGQEFTGVAGDVEHAPRALVRRGIVCLAEALELSLQGCQRVRLGHGMRKASTSFDGLMPPQPILPPRR